MKRLILPGLCAVATLAGVAVRAQQLPSAPAKGFGTSITGAFEGWFENADGTRTFLVGYYNRNIKHKSRETADKAGFLTSCYLRCQVTPRGVGYSRCA